MTTTNAPSADLWRLVARAMDMPTREHAALFDALGLAAPARLDALQAAHAEAFVTQCAPYVSVYVGETGQIGGEAAARVADFRRLLGAKIDADAPDAIADVLADYADLVALAAEDAQAAHARRAMFWEHIAPWAGVFADAVMRSAPPPYDGWAGLFQAVIRAEAASLPAPPAQALHLRVAAVWAEPAADATHADVARVLLVPVTTGLVLTRADLAMAGAELGIALPVGGRAFLLETLFRADTPATEDWLAAEAARQADARAVDAETLGDVAEFWVARAQASDDRLSVSSDRRVYVPESIAKLG
ncbi:molecular chaperone TorD family protein [Salinisphaera hydrothermalis]|uniref:molecular chaperone TorD family protein n=1 Tax=Salinisphaera hydrothermalis TaxID=563188 RepID=UPI00334207D3